MRNIRKKRGALFFGAVFTLTVIMMLPLTGEAKRKNVVKKWSSTIERSMYAGDKEPLVIRIKNADKRKKTVWRVKTRGNGIAKIVLKKNAICFYAKPQNTGKCILYAFKVIKKTRKKIYYRGIPMVITVKSRKGSISSSKSKTAAKKKTTTAAKKTTTAAKKTTTAAKKTTTAAKKTTTAAKKTGTTAKKKTTGGSSGTIHGRYGVFLGIEGDEIYKLDAYDTVVIEPEEFTAAQVSGLKSKGKTVLAYLNVGAIEKNRYYYDTFKSITLGSYDGWPNERWINVANPNWQNFVVNTLAKKYLSMGFQGFYVDNLDVYYHYETSAIYNGCLSVLKRLKAFNRIVMVNGADVLVRKLIAAGTVKNYLNVVNQEEVFSTNDGDVQDDYETQDYMEYLALAKRAGLKCCLLEYGTSSTVLSRIQAYANSNGFYYYYAPDRDLE